MFYDVPQKLVSDLKDGIIIIMDEFQYARMLKDP